MQYLIGTLHNRWRHSRQLRHVYAEAVLAATGHQFAHKHHPAVNLLYRHIIVGNAPVGLFHFIQFMVMRGKQRLGVSLAVLVQIFHYRPCNRDTVVCTCSTSELVKQYQATLAYVVEYRGRLGHFDHKSRLTERYVVACTHTGENLVDYANAGTVGRHETTYLRHQYNQCRLPQQGRLTSHVWSCYHYNLVAFVAKSYTIGNILLSRRQLLFNNRMPAFNNLNIERIVEDRTRITIVGGSLGKGKQTIEPGNQV